MNSIAHARPQARKLMISLFVAGTFLYWVSLYIYVPTLPAYVQTKTENLALVGSVLSMYGLWQAITRLPLGITADWVGHRKPFIVGGLLLAGFGALVMATANNPTGLLIGRSMTGLAAAAWATFVVAFSGFFPVHETIQSTIILTFVNSSGRILATSSTGVLNNWGGWALPFILAAVAAGLGVLLILPIKEETHSRKRPSFMGIAQIIKRWDVLTPSLLAALTQYVNWTTTFSFTPILAKQLGANDVIQSMLVAVHLGIVIIGNLSANYLLKRLGLRNLMLFSFSLLAVGIGLTAAANSIAVLFGVQLFIGMSLGINLPILMGLSIRNVEEAERNTAMGLHQSVYAIGIFLGPWLSGILAHSVGLHWMLALTTVGIVILGLPGAAWIGGIYDNGLS